ncbi:MAG: hypothetical protein ABIU54_02645 [Candidatus Eisenbacteria bacterium]
MGSVRGVQSLGAAAALAGFILAGCSGAPSSPMGNGISDPEFVHSAQVPEGAFGNTGDKSGLSGSKSIDGAAGGEISVGRFNLTFSKGAFQGKATVSITVPDTSVVSCQLSIDPPSANNFAAPVILRSDCSGTNVVVPSRLMQIWLDESSGVWRQVPGSTPDVANVDVNTPLTHFSLYGILEGKAGW